MKYVLVNSANEIEDTIDSVTPGGAEHYFMKRKKMTDEEKFYSVGEIHRRAPHPHLYI